MTTPDAIDSRVARWERWSWIIGVAGLLVCALVAWLDIDQFYRSYLVGYAAWWTISMGCLGMTMLSHLVTGRWAQVARPVLEGGMSVIPLLAVGFIPVIFGLESLYPWANADLVAHDEILKHREVWMNRDFFLARTAIYFVIWLGFGFTLIRWSTIQIGTGDVRSPRRLRLGSALGMVLFMTTIMFASFDWLMSLDIHWYSTAFGAIITMGAGVTALALVAVVLTWLDVWPSVEGLSPQKLRNDIGNLTLAFVMLWAYLAFSQYLIIWSGDQPSEIDWYLDRVTGLWGVLAIMLIALHFAIPFLALISRDVKQNPQWLSWVAGLLIAMHFVDIYWTTVPAYSHEGIAAHWADPIAAIGIGGLWTAMFCRNIRRRLPRVLRAFEVVAAREPEGQHV